MSAMRDFILKIVPKSWAEDMEAESRQWVMRCEACQFEQSIWDAGGLRWKAAGNPRRMRRCPNCGKVEWQAVSKRPISGE